MRKKKYENSYFEAVRIKFYSLCFIYAFDKPDGQLFVLNPCKIILEMGPDVRATLKYCRNK